MEGFFHVQLADAMLTALSAGNLRGILALLLQEHPMPRLFSLAAFVLFAATVGFASTTLAAKPKGPVYTSPADADADFSVQGEYLGTVLHEGQPMPLGVQVIARGDGAFDVVAYPGGLPGAGWQPPNKIVGTGIREGDGPDAIVRLEGVDWGGTTRRGIIRGGAIAVVDDAGSELTSLPKTVRKSPTLGAEPPTGAVVIFDGSNTDRLVNGRMTDDGLLMEGVTTKDSFGAARWHIEFCLPYQPFDRGQGRGNSGGYFQGSYEVQMLDSFGLEGKNNECGGIYKAAPPVVNMCLPPLSWQTYDVDVTPPEFADGKKVANARLTVRHNGVVIHDNVEVPGVTPGGPQKTEQPTGPLFLQNHGNPVRYRNIWVLPKS